MLFTRACVIINYMRKKAAILIIAILLCALVLGLTACAGTELESGYSDVVEEFYGDGMFYTSSYAAPAYATQFSDFPRVDKKLVVDNRISGSHITGLYLPAGESVTVRIPSSAITSRSFVSVIADDGSEVSRTPLLNRENTVTASEGGILLFTIGESLVSDTLSPLEIYFSGAMPAPFYRYGLDSEDDLGDLEAYGDMLIPLDCGNIRVYAPASALTQLTSLKETMGWWKSVVGYMSEALLARRTDGNISPVKAYYTQEANFETQILLTSDDMEGALTYDSFTQSSAGLSAMEKIGIALAGERSDGELLGKLAAYNAYMLFKDAFVIYDESSTEEQGKLYFSNGYAVLEKMMSGISDNPVMDVILCLMHSGGTAYSNEFLASFTSGVNARSIAENAAKVFGINACAFISDMLGESVSLNAEEGIREYIPAFNYYTRCVEDANEQNGYKVYAGATHKVDFAERTLIYGGEVKDISLQGSNGWERREDGYYYTALSENVRDGYTLTVTALVGGEEMQFVSYGDISLNVNAASYNLYTSLPLDSTENGMVTQTAMDSAVKIYEDYAPEYSASLGSADCGEAAYDGATIDSNTYTFSVTSFNFEVQEDGRYTFSIMNSDTGFCYYRVDFGVGDYEFTMFDNYVPVQTLGLLSHTEELKSGYVYRFDMYLIQPGISNSLTLYVSKDGGDYLPVRAEYMSFPGTSKSEQMKYTAPYVSLQGVAYPDTLYMGTDTSGWTGVIGSGASAVSGEQAAVLDGDASSVSSFVLSTRNRGTYTLNFDKPTELDYVRVYASAEGVNYAVMLYDGEWRKLADNLTGDIRLACDGSYSALRLEITGSGNLRIREIEAGNVVDNCTFVPHTSSSIWYEGNWSRLAGGVSINGSIAVNTGDAYAEYNFYGDEVAVMATAGPRYGNATIYIDGRKYTSISLHADVQTYQAVVFYAKLDEVGSHTIRVEAEGGNMINIDALAYSEGEYDPDDTAMPFNPYYLFILLAIVVAGVAICAVLDYKNKHKKPGKGKIAAINGAGEEAQEAADTKNFEGESSASDKKV